MKLLKFALLLCLSMMFATSHAQMAVKKSDAGRAANLSGDKKFELSIGYNDYIVSQPGDDSHWASSSFGGRVRIKELDCSLPLSLESGLFLYYFKDKYKLESDDDYYNSMEMFSFGVPLNLVYKIPTSSDFFVTPYAGLSARVNIWAEMELKNGKKIDLFNNQYGSSFKTMQLGGQIGVCVGFKRLVVRAEIHTDFGEICDETRMWGVGTSIGYRF